MPTTLYYFTGTGNSLHAARTIAERLGESKVINIARMKPGMVEDKSDTVGIVFPVYYMNAPNIVKDFVKRLRPGPKSCVFAVGTCGNMPGNSFSTLDRLLRANGGQLSAGFALKMVDNAYIGTSLLMTPPEKRDEAYKASEDGLNKIMGALKERGHGPEKYNYSIVNGLIGGMSSTWAASLYRLPRRFNVTDKCNGCSICEKICPTGNIRRIDKKITWGNTCTHCLACFHWCPRAAIEIGRKSAGVVRYHHPAIKVSDMVK